MVKLRLLSIGQWEIVVFEAVPKLRDKREAFGWRQTDNLVGAERFHSSSLWEIGYKSKSWKRLVEIGYYRVCPCQRPSLG